MSSAALAVATSAAVTLVRCSGSTSSACATRATARSTGGSYEKAADCVCKMAPPPALTASSVGALAPSATVTLSSVPLPAGDTHVSTESGYVASSTVDWHAWLPM